MEWSHVDAYEADHCPELWTITFSNGMFLELSKTWDNPTAPWGVYLAPNFSVNTLATLKIPDCPVAEAQERALLWAHKYLYALAEEAYNAYVKTALERGEASPIAKDFSLEKVLTKIDPK